MFSWAKREKENKMVAQTAKRSERWWRQSVRRERLERLEGLAAGLSVTRSELVDLVLAYGIEELEKAGGEFARMDEVTRDWRVARFRLDVAGDEVP